MEDIKKVLVQLWTILRRQKPLIKVVAVLLTAALILTALFMTNACSPQNYSSIKVNNRADSTTTRIEITNGDGGSTTIDVKPDTQLSL